MKLRVMSFNVRGDYNDGENKWEFRSGLNVRTVLECRPDVICFQEAQRLHLDTYRADLAGYTVIDGPKYNNGDPFSWNAVAYRSDRFEAVDVGGFWLSETPDEFSGSWETACIRSANWIRLKDEQGAVLICNTHLDHISAEAKVEGGKLICQRLAGLGREGEPVIVTGDFNTAPASEPVRAFVDAGFVDAFRAAGGEEGDSFHGFGPVASPGHDHRIDFVMLLKGSAGLAPVSAQIVRDCEPPLYPSDHCPVVVDFED